MHVPTYMSALLLFMDVGECILVDALTGGASNMKALSPHSDS